ncbi:MAG: hypothetical protein KDA20_10765 [Phycisphaerales bacterium]|nr:hypothetical protein [Phycisphaerales bacterium]
MGRPGRWLVAAMVLALVGAGGCESRAKERVSDVKRDFAARARDQEIPFGTSGTLKAGSVDLKTLQLVDVRFDNGDDLLMHAARAEIIVSVEQDTMMLRFFDVVAVMPEGKSGPGDGVIREEPVLASTPWKLDIDVVPD